MIVWHSFFFLFFALVACAAAVAVVVARDIVRMAFYLVVSLGSVAGLHFLAGADFVGAMQLMIYVGGTLVLLIFGVMLTSRGPAVSMKITPGNWVLATVVGGSLLVVLAVAAFSVDDWTGGSVNVDSQNTVTRLGMGLLGVRVDQLDEQDPALVGGLSGYLLPFEIVSMHLLVVLIGAAYLARTKRRVLKESPAEE